MPRKFNCLSIEKSLICKTLYNLIQFVSSHKTDQNYWRGINADGWENEALGMRKMITQFANIPANEIKGKQLISFI